MAANKYEYWTTSFQPTGNRWAESCGAAAIGNGNGNGNTQRASEPAIFVERRSSLLAWVIGSQESPHFLGVDLSGAVHRYHFDDDEGSTASNTTTNATLEGVSLLPTRPLIAFGNPLQPLVPPELSSPYSAAIPTSAVNGDLLYVDSNQILQEYYYHPSNIDTDTNTTNTDILTVNPVSTGILDPLVDAHITFSATNNMWALYTHSTNERYVHGILGDRYEGYHLSVLKRNETDGTIQVATEIILDDDDDDQMVFEGLAPMWTDVDGDGIDDLLTTVATSGRGAALRVYFLNEDGSVRQEHAQSNFIELGGRWLHQLASGPFGPRGELEIVETRTPHIGGYVRYYRYDEASSRLVNVASTEGDFTTHEIFSRNIDQAILADLNGDGIPELVVQSSDHRWLYGLQRTGTTHTDSKVERVWSVPLESAVRSNFAVSCSNGTAQLLFGTDNLYLYRVVFPRTTTDLPSPDTAFSLSSTSSTVWSSMILLMGYFFFRL
jgi:hypothetical protein